MWVGVRKGRRDVGCRDRRGGGEGREGKGRAGVWGITSASAVMGVVTFVRCYAHVRRIVSEVCGVCWELHITMPFLGLWQPRVQRLKKKR
jgi:hypothetical protein